MRYPKSPFQQRCFVRAQGLLAGRTGSTATSVLAFTPAVAGGAGLIVANTAPAGQGVFVEGDPVNGTRITLAHAGHYLVCLGTTVPGSGDLEIGIGVDVVQPFTGDPDLSVIGVLATAREIVAAGDSNGAFLAQFVTVLPQQAQAGGRVVTLCASNGGGGAPAAGDLVAAQTWFELNLISAYAGS